MNEPNVMTDERLDAIYHGATVNGMGVAFSAEAVIAIIDRLRSIEAENERLKDELFTQQDIDEAYDSGKKAENRQKDAECDELTTQCEVEKSFSKFCQKKAVDTQTLLRAAEAELAELRSLGGERWIDCKQELPPNGTVVMFNSSEKFGVWDRSGVHMGWYVENKKVFFDYPSYAITKSVTHWQSLPAPPTREKE